MKKRHNQRNGLKFRERHITVCMTLMRTRRSQSLKNSSAVTYRSVLVSQHLTLSPTEAADRLAIRELVERYAHCADRRDAKGQMSLFTQDTRFVVYMDARNPAPTQELHSREGLAPVFDDLNK